MKMGDSDCWTCGVEMKLCECGETEGYSSEGAVCPYCGDIDKGDESEGHLYDEYMYENECSSCGKVYKLDLYISYAWTTNRK